MSGWKQLILLWHHYHWRRLLLELLLGGIWTRRLDHSLLFVFVTFSILLCSGLFCLLLLPRFLILLFLGPLVAFNPFIDFNGFLLGFDEFELEFECLLSRPLLLVGVRLLIHLI